MKLKGHAHRFGNDVNTDEIIPAVYLNTTDPHELAVHCMDGIEPGFAKKIKTGDVIVAGSNFGCGSSREHAPFCIKAAGISCVIAESFARIFYRNSVNIGLPILESAEASRAVREGDLIQVDLKKGKIINITKKKTYSTQPFPEFMERIISSGGLLNMLKGGQ